MELPDLNLPGIRMPEEREQLQLFDELCNLLMSADTVRQLTDRAADLSAAIPELAPMVGFDQRSPHHAYDLYTHTAYVVIGVPRDLTLRWAALLHDIGKVPTFTRDETGRGHFYGHGPKGAQMAEEVLRRLKTPEGLRQQAVLLIAEHMTRLKPDRQQLSSQIHRLGMETVEQLLALQEADMRSKGTGKPSELEVFDRIRELLAELREEEE